MYEDYDIAKPRPWSAQERALIDWYRKARACAALPEDAFGMTSCISVNCPKTFYGILDFEVDHDQAETIRALRGGFIYDLEGLYICVEGKEFVHGGIQNLFEDGPEGNAKEDVPEEVRTVPLLFE